MRFLSQMPRMEMVTVRALRYSSTNMTTDKIHASSSVRCGVEATLASRSRKPISAPEACSSVIMPPKPMMTHRANW